MGSQQPQPGRQLGGLGTGHDEIGGSPVDLDRGSAALLQDEDDGRAVHGAGEQLAQGTGPGQIPTRVDHDDVGAVHLHVGGGDRGEALHLGVEEGGGGQDAGGVARMSEHDDPHGRSFQGSDRDSPVRTT